MRAQPAIPPTLSNPLAAGYWNTRGMIMVPKPLASVMKGNLGSLWQGRMDTAYDRGRCGDRWNP